MNCELPQTPTFEELPETPKFSLANPTTPHADSDCEIMSPHFHEKKFQIPMNFIRQFSIYDISGRIQPKPANSEYLRKRSLSTDLNDGASEPSPQIAPNKRLKTDANDSAAKSSVIKPKPTPVLDQNLESSCGGDSQISGNTTTKNFNDSNEDPSKLCGK